MITNTARAMTNMGGMTIWIGGTLCVTSNWLFVRSLDVPPEPMLVKMSRGTTRAEKIAPKSMPKRIDVE
jgi:hypothetical protein